MTKLFFMFLSIEMENVQFIFSNKNDSCIQRRELTNLTSSKIAKDNFSLIVTKIQVLNVQIWI